MRKLTFVDWAVGALAALVFLAFWTSVPPPRPAQALSSSPTACVTPKLWLKASNASTAVDIITTPTSGAKITSILMAVNDGGAGTIYYGVVRLTDGTTPIQLGQFLIKPTAASTGAGYSAGLGLFNYLMQIPGLPVDSDGNPYMLMTSSHTLQFFQGSSSVGTTANALQIIVTGCEF